MCHNSSSGAAEGWALSEVVSDTKPDTFSLNPAFPQKCFLNVFYIFINPPVMVKPSLHLNANAACENEAII